MPDKAVSLLDTAAARVAISQSATPAMIEDARVAIAAREAEKAALITDSDLGVDDKERIDALDAEIAALKEKLAGLETEWATEQALVNEIRSLREIIICRSRTSEGERARAAGRHARAGTRTAGRREEELARSSRNSALEGRDPEKRMIYAHVDEQSVASVVSDWTGIPVGRMVQGRDRDRSQACRTSSTSASSASRTAWR